MAIIFLNRYFHPDHSATAQMLGDLAFYLAEQGTEVTVITSRQLYDDPGAELPKAETVHGVSVVRVATPRFGRGTLLGRLFDYLGFYVTATIALVRHVRKGDTVVAKTDPPLISVPAAVVCRMRRAQLVNWIQDLFPETATALGVAGLGGRFGHLVRRLRNRSLTGARHNIVIGRKMQERLESQGVPRASISVIHNWADGQAITAVAHKDNPLRAAWGLGGKFVVGYSGNLGRAHETETVVRAADLLKDDADILFLFIGSGARLAALQAAVRDRGLGNVMFQPYQPRDQLAYSLGVPDAHLVILRPELEGMIVPSKFYGIAAAGRPVLFIGDADGEIARLLSESGSGYTVAPGNAPALAREVSRLKHATDSNKLGKAARTAFANHYDMAIALQHWQEVLDDTSLIKPP